tara:strand:- start:731 stop:2362 length:1632 start_codon:yes stop_codon:yes gene_type:complete
MNNENYLGNPNLKKTNVAQEFTKEQIEEYVKCSKDPVYFVEKYIKIVNLDEGFVNFNLYPFQEKMVKTFHKNRFSICKIPRQSGKSTTVCSYILWYSLFNENVNCAILANKGALARDLLAKIHMSYEALPSWLQQGIKVWNKGSIELENGSKIVAAATSSSAVRGGSYNLVFLDEFAFVPYHYAEDFFRSVYPTITAGQSTKVIVVSTPNGMNMFYKMWVDAENKRNLYKAIDVSWKDVPGRNAKFKEETIKNTSLEQWQQEFECEFLGSSNTLISPNTLRVLPYEEPIYKKDGVVQYKEPEKDKTYVLVADVARGVGLDYSAFIVVDVTSMPFEIVAVFRDNQLSPMMFPTIINKIGTLYNQAYVLTEINDIGQQVVDILNNEIEYENILSSSLKGRAGQVIGGGFASKNQLGIRTTAQLKRLGCSNLKSLVEEQKFIIRDFDIINELSTFVARGQSYEAEEGSHDDLAMCLVMFAFLSSQPYFKELTDTDIRRKLYDDKMRAIEDGLTPFGIIDDGSPRVEQTSFVDTTGDRWFYNDDELN